MTAQTVICPGCGAELKLKAGRTADRTAAECPRCGAAVPLAPADGADPTVAAPPAVLRNSHFPFLAPAQRPDEIGRLGRYRVLNELGRGGMGIVFRAEDTNLRRAVALKVMLPEACTRPVDKARFLREARAQAQVEHDHVAAIFEVGEEGGVAFLAMPLLKGVSLSDALKCGLPVPIAEAVRIAREVAEGLSAAHAVDLVHRDIKPGNIWLEGNKRRVKILDFGLARPANPEVDTSLAEAVTRQGAIVGTPAHMSPEQARGEPLDARSDLFSLGTVLYQMLTGAQPFRAPNSAAMLIAVATEHPSSPSALNPDVPAALDAVVMALLAKRPDDRPPTADAVAERLRTFEHAPITAPRPTAPASAADPWADIDTTGPESEPAHTEALTQTETLPPRPRAARWLVAGVGALVLVGLAGLIFAMRPTDTRNATTTPAPALPEPEPKTPVVAPTDREAAVYVLSVGGRVRIDDQELDCPVLPDGPFRLTYVHLFECKTLDDAKLVAFRGCAHLKHLNLHFSNVTDAGLAHFAHCTALTYLNLSDTRVTDVGLANFRNCKRLQLLDLHAVRASDDGVGHFAGCAALAHLDLSDTRVTDTGLSHFAGCRGLKQILLHAAPVTGPGLAHFAGCKELQHLDLNLTKVTDAGLANVRDCTELAWVGVDATDISDAGLAHLANCKKLTYLNLNLTKVTGAGLTALAGCTELKEFMAVRTKVDDAGLTHLKGFKGLTYLDINETKVSRDGVENFRTAVPGCTVDWGGMKFPPRVEP